MATPASPAGPVEVELAALEERIPPEHRMPGGCVYELKWDGYRMVIVRTVNAVRLWSRSGNDLTDRFPEIAAAAVEQMPPDAVVDGEVVIWADGRLSFDLLQHRLAGRSAAVISQARTHPASYIGFDLLSHAGGDVRGDPWTSRRQLLEDMALAWQPPLQLSPYTKDRAEAQRWFDDYRPAGIEGLVVKGAASRYLPGQRGWIKIKNRETRELIVGAVIGPMHRPDAVVAGLYTDAGELVVVGRSVPLSPAQSKSLGSVLTPPAGQHPWPDAIGSGRFGGSREEIVLTKVAPVVVVEVTADTALQGGRFRHPLRYVRHRPDLGADDLDIVVNTA